MAGTQRGDSGPASAGAALGDFIRTQRQLANLSLRQFAELTTLSNPYLSQLERGIHQPSLRVIKLIADALDLSVDTLLNQAGLSDAEAADSSVEAAIAADARLSTDQKQALLAVYRSMVGT